MTNENSSIGPKVRHWREFLALALVWLSFGASGSRCSAALWGNSSPAKLLAAPLSFEPNRGQAASEVQFLSHGAGYAVYLSSGKVVLTLERQQPASAAALHMSLIGANSRVEATALDPRPGVVSYFIGNDPEKWRAGIPTYGKVKYARIYPGVDLVFYGNQRQLEYDFVVAPGADPSRIAWRIKGARAGVDAAGNLVLNMPNGPAVFKKPVVYQMNGEQQASVEAAFAVSGNRVRFRLGSYDHSKALIIDPVLSYASYLGGSSTDSIGLPMGPGLLNVGASQGLAVDSAGSAYVTGYTYSVDFPAVNAYQSAPPPKSVSPGKWPSAFVTKFSPDGSSLVYSTYLGGSGSDYAYAIAVDASGSAYVTGQTNSIDFPVTSGAYQTVCSPAPTNQGPPYSAGCNSAYTSAFVTKLNSAGTGLVYSTFLGGNGSAYATAVAVDGAGRAYIAGNESEYCSTSFAFQGCFPTTSGAVIGGDLTGGRSAQYAFAAAFDPTGAHLLYSTLFGDLNTACENGCGGTYGTGVAVDANGYFYLIGETQAGRLPTTAGVVQPSGAPLDPTGMYVLSDRGYVAKFSPVPSAGGPSLVYATYLGGQTHNLNDYLSGIAIDSAGNAYVAGYTNSKDFPVTSGAYGTVCGPNGQNCAAAHVTKLNPSASAILWSTYVGDAKPDASDAVFFTGPIQLDGHGNVYIIAQNGGGAGFPTINPVEPTPAAGNQQLLIAELDPTGSQLLFSTTIGSNGLNTTSPAGLAVDAAGNIYVAGNTNGPDLVTTPGAFQTASSDGACCQYGNGFVAKIAANAPPAVKLATAGQVEPFAAESIVAVYGTDLAGETASAQTVPLPTSIDGNMVTVTDSAGAARQAPLFYISGTQINFEIPAGTATGAATVAIKNQNGTTQSTTISIGSVSPGIFQLNAAGLVAAWVLPVISGTQQPLQPVYQVADGSVVALPVSLGSSNEQVYLEIYGTGLRSAKSVTATVGSLTVPVLYAGPAPGWAGEDQVNIGPLPQALAGQGSLNIVVAADGQQANVVTVTIQ
ncbi:MAG TPA: SBBP repeat-containing protein [Bryobacteraceae bacterium]|nr:SBBP repeat-containing protein [Bryobacteraceae bacterium]